MPIDIRKYLTHFCQLGKVTGTLFNDTAVTSVYTATCFSFYGNSEEIVSNRQFTKRVGWTVIMPNSFSTLVAVGDQVTNLVNAAGTVLVPSAKVGEITIYHHHLFGTQFVQLQLDLQ